MSKGDAVIAPLIILFTLNLVATFLLSSTAYGFTQPTTISIGASGVNYAPASQCSNVFANIPLVGGFVAWLEAGAADLVNPSSTYCQSQAGAFIIFTYDPSVSNGNTFAITNLFVSLIPMALVAVVISGFSVAGSGYNSGAVMTLVIGGAFMTAWAVLSGSVLAIMFVNDAGILTILLLGFYAVLTLIFAIGTFKVMSGSSVSAGGSDL